MTSCRPVMRRKDSGFALLLVFLMAAVVAISLYMEMPRMAFQAQRQKEQMLMERGEQYKRAIGLFLRANRNTRWPASIDELENYNNKHFLRHRYLDPITGKDEWRIIHISNGVLTDSITNKKPDADQAHLSKNGSVMELQGLDSSGATGQQSVSAATRRRPSEGGAPQVGPDGQPIAGPPPFPGASGATGPTNLMPIAGIQTQQGPGAPQYPGQSPYQQQQFPGQFPGQQQQFPGQTQQPGGAPGIAGLLGIPTAPTGPTNTSSSSNSSSSYGGIPAVGMGGSNVGGGTPTQSPVSGAVPAGFPGAVPAGFPSANGVVTGATPGAGANPSINPNPAAIGMIQNLLTQPRPGGMQGLPTTGQSTVMGNGIAGIASKSEGDSIMVYADKTKFNEWEFIYDPAKFKPPQNPNTGSAVGTPASQLASSSGRSSSSGPGQMGGASPPFGSSIGGSGGIGGPGGMASPGAIGAPGGIGGASPFGASGAAGASGATGAAGTPMGGSAAFGQPGGPDIRPGKQ